MLSFLQKSDQLQMPLVPAWHPNFRNHERLPDTKVVRTQFFVNLIAIAVAGVLLLYLSFQEYRIDKLKGQVADWQTRINTNKKASDQAIAASVKFADQEKRIAELNDFLQQRLRLSEFLLHLSSTLPKEIALDAVDVRTDPRDPAVTLRGLAFGTQVEASGFTSAYVERLRQDPYFSGIFEDVKLDKQERDQASGQLMFSLALRFKGATAKK
jgi:uncharacterized coiled-coil protein SlyX